MKSIWQKLHRIGDVLHLPDMPNWVVGILALVLILRIPSFFEPYYYGDEMIYVTLGQGVRQGMTLYKDVYDNKPPLLYLTAAISENLFWFKAILAFWSLITVFIFYRLSKLLFEKNERAQQIATILFAVFTTIPLWEGNIANAELFMIGPSMLAFLILLGKNLTSKKIFLAGALFGISVLFKVPALFELPVIVFYWLITGGVKDWKNIFKKTFILGLGLATPILLTFIWYFFRGALFEYVRAAFLQNVGYLSSFRPDDVQKPFLVKNGPLLIRGLIVLLGSGVLFLFRKKLSSKFIFFCLWTLFTLFAIALSERPYPHYFIQAIAPLAFLLAMFFTERSLEQSLVVIPLALAFAIPVYYNFYFYPTFSYYQRFINFATNKIDKQAYFNSFGSNVNRNYEIAEFLTMSTTAKEKVFMWDTDSATVYALARRLPPVKYVADYHVNDYSNKAEVAKILAQNPPKFIITTSGYPYPEINSLLAQKYLLVRQIGNANLYSRLSLVPRN